MNVTKFKDVFVENGPVKYVREIGCNSTNNHILERKLWERWKVYQSVMKLIAKCFEEGGNVDIWPSDKSTEEKQRINITMTWPNKVVKIGKIKP